MISKLPVMQIKKFSHRRVKVVKTKYGIKILDKSLLELQYQLKERMKILDMVISFIEYIPYQSWKKVNK